MKEIKEKYGIYHKKIKMLLGIFSYVNESATGAVVENYLSINNNIYLADTYKKAERLIKKKQLHDEIKVNYNYKEKDLKIIKIDLNLHL